MLPEDVVQRDRRACPRRRAASPSRLSSGWTSGRARRRRRCRPRRDAPRAGAGGVSHRPGRRRPGGAGPARLVGGARRGDRAALGQRGRRPARGRGGAGDLHASARARRWSRADADAEPVRPAVTWQDRRPVPAASGCCRGWRGSPDAEPRAVAAGTLAALPRGTRSGLWLSGEAATTLQAHEAARRRRRSSRRRASRRTGSRRRCRSARRSGRCAPRPPDALGLPPGIPVVAGVNDGTASMLGAGLLDARRRRGHGRHVGRDRDLRGPSCRGAGGCSSRPRRCPAAGSWAGRWPRSGATVDWLRSAVLGRPLVHRRAVPRPPPAVAPGADGLVLLPYLAGERAPVFDDAARGAFVGLTLGHGPRAPRSGGPRGARRSRSAHVAEPLAAAGAPIRELRLAGRPAPDDAWARIKADVLGVPGGDPGGRRDRGAWARRSSRRSGVGAVPSLEAGVSRRCRRSPVGSSPTGRLAPRTTRPTRPTARSTLRFGGAWMTRRRLRAGRRGRPRDAPVAGAIPAPTEPASPAPQPPAAVPSPASAPCPAPQDGPDAGPRGRRRPAAAAPRHRRPGARRRLPRHVPAGRPRPLSRRAPPRRGLFAHRRGRVRVRPVRGHSRSSACRSSSGAASGLLDGVFGGAFERHARGAAAGARAPVRCRVRRPSRRPAVGAGAGRVDATIIVGAAAAARRAADRPDPPVTWRSWPRPTRTTCARIARGSALSAGGRGGDRQGASKR